MKLMLQSKIADTFGDLDGALIVVMAVICMGDVLRRGRYLNILIGLIVAVASWFVQDSNLGLNISGTISGLLVAVLAIPLGSKKEIYGLWDNTYVRNQLYDGLCIYYHCRHSRYSCNDSFYVFAHLY